MAKHPLRQRRVGGRVEGASVRERETVSGLRVVRGAPRPPAVIQRQKMTESTRAILDLIAKRGDVVIEPPEIRGPEARPERAMLATKDQGADQGAKRGIVRDRYDLFDVPERIVPAVRPQVLEHGQRLVRLNPLRREQKRFGRSRGVVGIGLAGLEDRVSKASPEQEVRSLVAERSARAPLPETIDREQDERSKVLVEGEAAGGDARPRKKADAASFGPNGANERANLVRGIPAEGGGQAVGIDAVAAKARDRRERERREAERPVSFVFAQGSPRMRFPAKNFARFGEQDAARSRCFLRVGERRQRQEARGEQTEPSKTVVSLQDFPVVGAS